jgi:membrane associated rhomboid family serine protease
VGYEDRDYMPATDSVEKRISMSRVLMFILLGWYGFETLWSSTLILSDPLAGGFFRIHFLLTPLSVVHKFALWQPFTYWLFECSPWAVVFDALTLWWFGHMIEEHLGTRKFAMLWGGGILVPAILYVALGYLLFPGMPYFGPGGAMLAMIVAAAIQWPNMSVIFIFVPMRLKWLALIYVGVNLAYGLQTLGPPYWATLAGGAWGFVFWRYHRRVSDALARWDANSERRAEVKRSAGERQESAEVDRILEKIAREGMPSLTSAERKVLDRASRNRRDA